MNKSLLENRKLAGVVLVLAVVLSIFGIGGAKLSGVAQKAETFFAENIMGDITARKAAANNFLDVTKESVGGSAAYSSAQKALEQLENSVEADEVYRANVQLTSSIELLYGEYCDKNGEPSTGSVEQEQLSELRSRDAIISHSVQEYNDIARDAQQKMSGFPAGIIAALTGADVAQFA